MNPEAIKIHHFLDEAGDTTFFGKGNIPILGTDGVSNNFILGKVVFKTHLQTLRNEILALENDVLTNPYFQVASVHKKRNTIGKFYFHATDDLPELRMLFYNFIKKVDCAFEVIIAGKNVEKFAKKHNGNEKEFMLICLRICWKTILSLRQPIFLLFQAGGIQRGPITWKTV